MRLAVMSDSHRNFDAVLKVVQRHLSDVDLFLHLGDGARDLEEVSFLYPQQRFLWVRGNCDYSSDAPEENCLSCGGQRIFYTHGHLYQVKEDLDVLWYMARKQNAQLALYGHTHRASIEYRDGIYLVNPGCLGSVKPQYAVIEVTGREICPSLLTL